MADIDSDGDLDVLFANSKGLDPPGQNYLFLNDGQGKFTDVTASYLPPGNGNTSGLVASDLDGDGDLDLAYSTGAGKYWLGGQVLFNLQRHVHAGLPPTVGTAYSVDAYGRGSRQLPLRVAHEELMQRLFVDTGAWMAYVNRNDARHDDVRGAFRDSEGRLVSSNFVFDETITLCASRLSHGLAVRVGDLLLDRDAVDLIRVTPKDENAAWRLCRSRPDQRYSFTDCTSFVLMRRLGLKHAAALDDDCRREGFLVMP